MKQNLIIDIATLRGSADPSITKILERYLPDIERYREQGVPRQVILDHLNSIGFALTMSTFETILKRLRKRKKSRKASAPLSSRQPVERDPNWQNGGDTLYRGSSKKLDHDLKKTIDW